MEASFTGKLKEISVIPEKSFGFLLQSEKYEEIRITPLFPGDDHWDWKYSKDELFFTTFDDEIKNIILNLKVGQLVEVIFKITSKQYSNLWYTFLNPISIKILDSKVEN